MQEPVKKYFYIENMTVFFLMSNSRSKIEEHVLSSVSLLLLCISLHMLMSEVVFLNKYVAHIHVHDKFHIKYRISYVLHSFCSCLVLSFFFSFSHS